MQKNPRRAKETGWLLLVGCGKLASIMLSPFLRKVFFIILPALIFSGCQATLPPRTIIPQNVPRSAETPLVVAIPGLSLPPFLPQEKHFGKLTQMLDKEGIPSFVLLYDSKSNPIPAVADLSSNKTSVLELRVLPRLDSAISQENMLRRAQGLPKVKEVDLVTYSQGSVVAWDLIRRLVDFQEQYEQVVTSVGKEWDYFEKDPIFQNFIKAFINFLLMDNLRAQYGEAFEKYIDLKNVYAIAEENMLFAAQQLRAHTDNLKFVPPDAEAKPGKEMAYPRSYPKIVSWFDKNYPPESQASINFFTNYALYKELLSVRLRIFSICGSFLGSPEANAGYFFIKHFPKISKLFVKNRAEQINDTRLGNPHSLAWTKDLIKFENETVYDEDFEDIYFVSGAHGTGGDGLVDQASSHLCLHSISKIPVQKILDPKEKSLGELKLERLPFYPLSALNVWHLPKNRILYQVPGASQMEHGSKVYPYLLAFLKKDFKKLEALRTKEETHLRQFMVLLYFSGTWEELKKYDFRLKSASKEIKIEKPINNQTTHALAWSGYFPEKDYLNTQDTGTIEKATAILEIKSPSGEVTTAEITVTPGVTHFVEITS